MKSNQFLSNHLISYQLLSTPINTYQLISYHIKSYQIISYHIKSYQIMSNHVKSCQIISHHIKSYQIISNHIKSYQMIWFARGSQPEDSGGNPSVWRRGVSSDPWLSSWGDMCPRSPTTYIVLGGRPPIESIRCMYRYIYNMGGPL